MKDKRSIPLSDHVAHVYKKHYGNEPLLIFSPGRINIIGEHTDYNEGYVFPAAIDKGIYAAIGKSSSGNSMAHALDVDETYTFSTGSMAIETPGSWKNYIVGVVGELMKKGTSVPDFNFVFAGDIPGGSGLSSSAALENSVVFGLNELFDLGLTKEEMIFISQKAEHNYVGVKCGIMDQYASMFGQQDKALLLDCRTIKAVPFPVELGAYELLLINTNVKHTLSDSAYNNRRAVCEEVSEKLGINALRDADEQLLKTIEQEVSAEDYEKVLYVVQENTRVLKASEALQQADLQTVGELLYETHEGLRKQYRVSCEELDFLVDYAKENTEVLGARMMGGGFGGCTINIIHKDALSSFKEAIAAAYLKAFNRDCSFYNVHLEEGTHVL